MVVCDLRYAGGIGVWFCVAVHYSALVRLAGHLWGCSVPQLLFSRCISLLEIV